jgi:hypothetical protein
VVSVVKLAYFPYAGGAVTLGYRLGVVALLTLVFGLCTALLIIPRTVLRGAILLAGYLCVAVATYLRVADRLPAPVPAKAGD